MPNRPFWSHSQTLMVCVSDRYGLFNQTDVGLSYYKKNLEGYY